MPFRSRQSSRKNCYPRANGSRKYPLVEPANSTDQEADRCGFLLAGQHNDLRQAVGVIDHHVGLIVADAPPTALSSIAGDPVTDSLKARQLLGIEIDNIIRLLTLVPLHTSLGFEILHPVDADLVIETLILVMTNGIVEELFSTSTILDL